MSGLVLLAAILPALLAQGHQEAVCEQFTLPNGSRVVVMEEPWNPLIAIGVVVAAGVGDEGIYGGIGAVAAHASLRGTKHLPAASVARDIARAGDSVVVGREPDCLTYTAVTTRSAFADATYALCQALMHPSLDAEAVAWARGRVVRALEREGADPLATATAAFRNAAFRSAPYGGSLYGTRESLARITAEVVDQWHQAHVTSDRTTFAICGAIDAATVREILTRQLAEFTRRSRGRFEGPKDPERLLEDLTVRRQRPIHTAIVGTGFPGPGVSHSDYPAFLVLATILGGGKASRLFQAFRDEVGIGYEVGAEYPGLLAASYLVGYLELDASKLDDGGRGAKTPQLRERVRSIFARASSVPPTDAELRRAKMYLRGSLLRRTERARDRALWAAWQVGVARAAPELDAFLKTVEQVSAQQVLEAARRYLEKGVDLLILPEARGVPSP